MPQKIFIHFLCGSWTPPLLDLSPVDAEGRLCLSSSQQPLCTKAVLPPHPPAFFSLDHTKLIPSLFPPGSCFFRPLVAFLWTFSNLSICISNYSCIYAEKKKKKIYFCKYLCDTTVYIPLHKVCFFHNTDLQLHVVVTNLRFVINLVKVWHLAFSPWKFILCVFQAISLVCQGHFEF